MGKASRFGGPGSGRYWRTSGWLFAVFAVLAGCGGSSESNPPPTNDAGDTGVIHREDSAVPKDSTPPGQDSGVVVEDSRGPAFDSSNLPDVSDAPREGGFDITKILPLLEDAGVPAACSQCVRNQCSEGINACVNDPTCVAASECVVAKCTFDSSAASGKLTAAQTLCLAGCFNNDLTKAVLYAQTLQCLGGCQDDCRTPDAAVPDARPPVEASVQEAGAPDAPHD